MARPQPNRTPTGVAQDDAGVGRLPRSIKSRSPDYPVQTEQLKYELAIIEPEWGLTPEISRGYGARTITEAQESDLMDQMHLRY